MSQRGENFSIIDDFVRAEGFPCVAAKSASHRGNIVECQYADLADKSHDTQILKDLDRFIEQDWGDGNFRSFVACFGARTRISERSFETLMWRRLQSLHVLDSETHEWDRSVSCDPSSSSFSFSLRGKAFFVIGLHPQASRLSRRYPWPALVFNLHEQFETLRREGRYNKMRETIRQRDAAFCGSPNPYLRSFGEQSEARQYSGSAINDNWRCPFRPVRRRA